MKPSLNSSQPFPSSAAYALIPPHILPAHTATPAVINTLGENMLDTPSLAHFAASVHENANALLHDVNTITNANTTAIFVMCLRDKYE